MGSCERYEVSFSIATTLRSTCGPTHLQSFSRADVSTSTWPMGPTSSTSVPKGCSELKYEASVTTSRRAERGGMRRT